MTYVLVWVVTIAAWVYSVISRRSLGSKHSSGTEKPKRLTIQNYLDARAREDELFAPRYANPKKNILCPTVLAVGRCSVYCSDCKGEAIFWSKIIGEPVWFAARRCSPWCLKRCWVLKREAHATWAQWPRERSLVVSIISSGCYKGYKRSQHQRGFLLFLFRPWDHIYICANCFS